MERLTCENVIDNINHHLRNNGTGEQVMKENTYQISIISGLVDSVNDVCCDETKEDIYDR